MVAVFHASGHVDRHCIEQFAVVVCKTMAKVISLNHSCTVLVFKHDILQIQGLPFAFCYVMCKKSPTILNLFLFFFQLINRFLMSCFCTNFLRIFLLFACRLETIRMAVISQWPSTAGWAATSPPKE